MQIKYIFALGLKISIFLQLLKSYKLQKTIAMQPDQRLIHHKIWQSMFAPILFAIALGFLETICVIYLRQLIFPGSFDIHHLAAPVERMPVELIREACTLIILTLAAWMVGFNWRSRIYFFFMIFGIWDITYYTGLKWLAHWPLSWLGWDCLFLIPKPWFGPVLAPLGISICFIFASILFLIKEKRGFIIRFSFPAILFKIIALMVWYYSFTKDSSRIMERGYSGITYSWILYALGLISAISGLWLSLRSQHSTSNP